MILFNQKYPIDMILYLIVVRFEFANTVDFNSCKSF